MVRNKTSILRYISFIMIMCIAALGFSTVESKALSHSEINSLVIKTLYNGQGGKMTCDFDGYKNTKGRHEGVDYKLKEGKNVHSIISGKVIRVTNTSSNSKLSTLAIYDASNDKTVIYLHIKNICVKNGQNVKKGQKVAQEGNRAAGSAHTHIEVRDGEKKSAAKSVNDYNLENQSPYSYFEKVLKGGGSVPSNSSKKYLSHNEFKPITTYTKTTSQRVNTYKDKNLKHYSGQIFVNDQCKILEFYSNNSCKVSYPVSKGYKTAYTSLYRFFDYNTITRVYLKSNTNVYEKSAMKKKIGTSYASDTVYMVGTSKTKNVKIVYNISGGYKAGWISSSKIK